MPQVQRLLCELTILVLPILLAVTLHDATRGYTADQLGELTPRRADRLTLNLFGHLDVTSSFLFLVTGMIAWAKLMLVNVACFMRPRRDRVSVSLAGPVANFALAAALASVYRLLAIHLDAHGTALEPALVSSLILIIRAGVMVNLRPGWFQLVRIPPLDTRRVLASLLPGLAFLAEDGLKRQGFVMLFIPAFSGALSTTFPALGTVAQTLLGT